MKTLLSMRAFVVWVQTQDFSRIYKDQVYQQAHKMHLCDVYSKFLDLVLELGMFVPCVDGVPIEKPSYDAHKKIKQIGLYHNKLRRFKQAKEKVLFEGLNVIGYDCPLLYLSNGLKSSAKTIEDLVWKKPTLTKAALKQIEIEKL